MEEQEVKITEGEVEKCFEAYNSKNEKYFKIFLKNDKTEYRLKKNEGFDLGERIKFSYRESEFNGVTYYFIKDMMDYKNVNDFLVIKSFMSDRAVALRCAVDVYAKGDIKVEDIVNKFNEFCDLLKIEKEKVIKLRGDEDVRESGKS